jgi:DeoR/GlpR family transcriptional regulator of sugar metabolism
LSNFTSDAAVLGCDSADRDGLYTTDMNVAQVSRLMIENSDRSIFVTDSSKFGQRSFVRYAQWRQVNALVTDDGLDNETRRWLGMIVDDLRIVSAIR